MRPTLAAARGTILFAAALGLAHGAAAGPNWQLVSFSVPPENAATVAEAADTLMGSPVGKEFQGRLLLIQQVADGSNPATHSFVSLYPTVAAREAFGQKLQQDPAWNTFLGTLSRNTDPVATVRYATLRSWGDVADTDVVWQVHFFDVQDPQAFATALDQFMTSEKGQQFPGQVHLSAVSAGGMTPVSHVIAVGFASEAEMETWDDSLQGNAAWTTYLERSNASSSYQGAELSRTLQQWGPATMKDVTAAAEAPAGP